MYNLIQYIYIYIISHFLIGDFYKRNEYYNSRLQNMNSHNNNHLSVALQTKTVQAKKLSCLSKVKKFNMQQ